MAVAGSFGAFHILTSFVGYSAGIAIFMAGANWGRTVDMDEPSKLVLATSNLITLAVIGLCLFVFYSFPALIIGIGIAHGLNLVFEAKRENAKYQKLRIILTTVVLVSHLAMLALLVMR
ncbi:hypothetical protein JCM19232_3956 [Vibrio ishigakensis]|uniref:Uncharacterized protein n=1 Tax=Vibrio ishigakensis TaxID=1481914 RepID=A0A0B8PDV4_9VIBR|nr:hypothetical protein JCM19232_3956 [Vibrio ishigakensis]